jgi:hypothetical protein
MIILVFIRAVAVHGSVHCKEWNIHFNLHRTYSIPHKKKLENVTSTIKQTDRSIKWEGQANIVKHGSHTYLDIW